MNCKGVALSILDLLPWVCSNILEMQKFLRYEEVQVVLRAVQFLSEQQKRVGKISKREKMIGQILNCIQISIKEDPAHIDQILDMELQDMLEIGLASDKIEPKMYAVKVIGALMAGTDNVSMQIYQKMPDIHIMLVNNILSLSLDDSDKDGTSYDQTLI